jgi:sulfite reductase (NADPH) flavoprotein alpha-component
MLRRLHSWPGLVAGVLVVFMAITGTVLSLQPALEHWSVGSAPATAAVAEVAGKVAASHDGLNRIVQTASGSVIAYSSGPSGPAAQLVDPVTGLTTGPYDTSGIFAFLTELHRSLFLGQAGHGVAGVAALAMVVLALSGILMLVRRLGGWSMLLATARGTLGQRLHVELSRMAIVGLLLSALTGLYMSLVSFGFIPDGTAGIGGFGSFPPAGSGGEPAAISTLSALQQTPLAALRELDFPLDRQDVFTLITASGQGYVDPSTGEMLSFTSNNAAQQLYELIFALHTGQGIWWLGLLLGMAALAVPVLATTGVIMWLTRWRSRPRFKRNVGRHAADSVILVGSEGGTTWGFAAELHLKLTEDGFRVHTAPMNSLADYPNAESLFLFTSTYGDGGPPASANRFLARLERLKLRDVPSFTVLGFGDRSFPHFCRFAEAVDEALVERGWQSFQPMSSINRQSPQAFAAWGAVIGERLGVPLTLHHVPAPPRTSELTLVGRVDYGIEVQAPTAVLRFAAEGRRSKLPGFQPGDLLGIVPPGSTIPRYYSLASDSRDGFAEICVRKQHGGLSSEFLHALGPGDAVEAFVRHNRDFRPAKGRKPVVMIANGTGIAPFVGFIWGNRHRRPVHLYWGGRDPHSDLLYGDTLARCLDDRRLARQRNAFSRVAGRAYVQDRLREDIDGLSDLLAHGAQIMVCGSLEMATSIREVVAEALAPLGLTLETLRAKGRYLEDVY